MWLVTALRTACYEAGEVTTLDARFQRHLLFPEIDRAHLRPQAEALYGSRIARISPIVAIMSLRFLCSEDGLQNNSSDAFSARTDVH
jgi:hypothetical protein